MFPLLPFHGQELAQLYVGLGRSLAGARVVRRARDLGAVVILVAVIAVGLYALLELVPFALQPPRVA